ncbi:hypothetical protein [Halosolutus gelatinilyticus]|uniref:hypothetical protein n=1 Tax=Halosolutus gelatinilyticus TaxID=2931975 RepID=UPI001FF154BA|nr:hypothetical protein [Halosolutus gelatinilyticus]
MSSEAATHGERTTCERCGLPYYADRDGCPYCERASVQSDSTATDHSPQESAGAANPADAETTETDPSLLERISDGIRSVLRSR